MIFAGIERTRSTSSVSSCAPWSLRSGPGARRTHGEALALAEELQMRPLVAHCHLGLGTLHRRTGRRERAREHLTLAVTMYRDMDMPFWLTQAEAVARESA